MKVQRVNKLQPRSSSSSGSSLREQNQAVSSSRVSAGWSEKSSSSSWETMGVPSSAKHLPQSSKQSCRAEPGLPKPGLGLQLGSASLGNTGRGLGCRTQHLHGPEKKREGSQQERTSLQPSGGTFCGTQHLSHLGSNRAGSYLCRVTLRAGTPGVYLLCPSITEGASWLFQVGNNLVSA